MWVSAKFIFSPDSLHTAHRMSAGPSLQTYSGSSFNLPITCISSGGANSYASHVTIGVARKFSVGGGDAVLHSRPGIWLGALSVTHRPDQIDHRNQEPEAEN